MQANSCIACHLLSALPEQLCPYDCLQSGKSNLNIIVSELCGAGRPIEVVHPGEGPSRWIPFPAPDQRYAADRLHFSAAHLSGFYPCLPAAPKHEGKKLAANKVALTEVTEIAVGNDVVNRC